MSKRPAVSANDTPYSLTSFNAIALLSFGKGGRRLPVCIIYQQRPGITLSDQINLLKINEINAKRGLWMTLEPYFRMHFH
jgi:hypothetical protein